MSAVYYFLLMVTLIFQQFIILFATAPVPRPGPYGPSYVPSSSPTYIPAPSPSHHNNIDSPPSPGSAKSKGSSKGMIGERNAGLTFGIIAGAALLVFAGMVYAKRQKLLDNHEILNLCSC